MYDKIKELAEQSHMAWAMQTDVNRKCVGRVRQRASGQGIISGVSVGV